MSQTDVKKNQGDAHLSNLLRQLAEELHQNKPVAAFTTLGLLRQYLVEGLR